MAQFMIITPEALQHLRAEYEAQCLRFMGSLYRPRTEEDISESYGMRIYLYLRRLELRYVMCDLTEHLERNNVTAYHRAVMCDWIIQAEVELVFPSEATHTAISILDMFLTKKRSLGLNRYKYATIAAIFLGSKYVQRPPLNLKELCEFADNILEPRDVLDSEIELLEAVDFNFNIPLPEQFLYRFLQKCNDLNEYESERVWHLCRYLIDIGVKDIEIAKITPSIRCAAVVFLARRLFNLRRPIPQPQNPGVNPRLVEWPQSMVDHTQIQLDGKMQEAIFLYGACLLDLQERSPDFAHQVKNAFLKYATPDFLRISRSEYCQDLRPQMLRP